MALAVVAAPAVRPNRLDAGRTTDRTTRTGRPPTRPGPRANAKRPRLLRAGASWVLQTLAVTYFPADAVSSAPQA